MDPITLGLLIGGGSGLLKSYAVDLPKEQRDRELAAQTQRYSPWTNLKADKVQAADPFGSALQFGATGAAFGSGIQQAEEDKRLKDAMSGYFAQGGQGSRANANAPASPWARAGALGVDTDLGPAPTLNKYPIY